MPDLTITAVLTAPIVGLVEQDIMLDGPLAWAAWQDAERRGMQTPPITPTECADFALPLARWDMHGTWGWCVSSPRYEVVRHTAIQTRRKPATREMARFTTEREHHSGLGPYKARDVTRSAAWVTSIAWDAHVTDDSRLEALLALVSHLGAERRVGHGRVAEWITTPCEPDSWQARPLPTPGTSGAFRAPYWHPSRRITVAAG